MTNVGFTDGIDGDIVGAIVEIDELRYAAAEAYRHAVGVVLDVIDIVVDGGTARHHVEVCAVFADQRDLLVDDILESDRAAALPIRNETNIVAVDLGRGEMPIADANGVVGVITIDGDVAVICFAIDDLFRAVERDGCIAAGDLDDLAVD